MKDLRFDMLYSYFHEDAENTEDVKRLNRMHPEKAMQELGITYREAIPQSIGDQWWFLDCEDLPEKMPPFLTELTLAKG